MITETLTADNDTVVDGQGHTAELPVEEIFHETGALTAAGRAEAERIIQQFINDNPDTLPEERHSWYCEWRDACWARYRQRQAADTAVQGMLEQFRRHYHI